VANEPISSRTNPRVKDARRLHLKKHRMTTGLFLAEGEDVVGEALSAGILPVETFLSSERPPEDGLVARLTRGGAVHLVTDAVMADLSELGHPPRLIAVFDSALLTGSSDPDGVGVYLHQVTDPGNVGTIIRAVAALGGSFVALSPGCADPLSGKAVRASMGAIFHVGIELAAKLPVAGRRLALTTTATTPIWNVDLTEPVTLVVGAERDGLPYDVASACDAAMRIPQTSSADSLNAASAATVALYEIARQRAIQTESLSSSDGARPSNQP
jgi:TrmH family RNA methyltransferase